MLEDVFADSLGKINLIVMEFKSGGRVDRIIVLGLVYSLFNVNKLVLQSSPAQKLKT